MAVEKIDVNEYKVCVAKGTLPSFLEACKYYAPMMPVIEGEFARPSGASYWIVSFCAQKPQQIQPEEAGDHPEEPEKPIKKTDKK